MAAQEPLRQPPVKRPQGRYLGFSIGLHVLLVVILAVATLLPRSRPVQPSGGTIIQANLVDMREVNRQQQSRREAQLAEQRRQEAERIHEAQEKQAQAEAREQAAAAAEAAGLAAMRSAITSSVISALGATS